MRATSKSNVGLKGEGSKASMACSVSIDALGIFRSVLQRFFFSSINLCYFDLHDWLMFLMTDPSTRTPTHGKTGAA
jgi:hypothetical protein